MNVNKNNSKLSIFSLIALFIVSLILMPAGSCKKNCETNKGRVKTTTIKTQVLKPATPFKVEKKVKKVKTSVKPFNKKGKKVVKSKKQVVCQDCNLPVASCACEKMVMLGVE